MGLSYSLCALMLRSSSAKLLQNLSSLLTVDSRSRIENLHWAPEREFLRKTAIGTTELDGRGVAGLSLANGESVNDFCFILSVSVEPELCFHFQAADELDAQAPHSFGCMWTSVACGRKYLQIEMTAATSGMSRVLQSSAAVHQLWRDFAKTTGVMVAYVHLEDQSPIRLWPGKGDLILPDADTLTFKDDYHYSIDLFAEYVRNSNDGLE